MSADPRFLGGAKGVVITDTRKMALTVVVDFDGVADIQPGEGISKQQAATWLRELAKSLEASS